MRLLVLFLASIAFAAPLSAQRIPVDSVDVADGTKRYSVRLRDGTTLLGRITAVTADSVRITMDSGEVALSRAAIDEVRAVDGERFRGGSYWFPNPHATRLLFSATAIPLEKGAGYYSNTWLVFHAFAVGLTERFTLGGGMFWFPGVPLDETVYFLMPKYTVANGDRFKVAVGALAGLLPFGTGDADRTSAGILYGVGTAGTGDSNLSLGLGWGYAGDEIAGSPVTMLGGQHRVSRRMSLISENWIFPFGDETEGLYSYGLRFLGESLTVDLAFVSPFGETSAVPWLGFAFRF